MLVEAKSSVLLLIDCQTKLAPAVLDLKSCLARCGLLIAAARKLDIPILASEHCPNSIGPIIPELRAHLEPSEIIEKRHFNGALEPALEHALTTCGRRTVVLAGMEAHICVLQTALGLNTRGRDTAVVSDAIASRQQTSKDLAISRLSRHGVDIVDTEMVLFEWLEMAGTTAFNEILPMIKSGSAG